MALNLLTSLLLVLSILVTFNHAGPISRPVSTIELTRNRCYHAASPIEACDNDAPVNTRGLHSWALLCNGGRAETNACSSYPYKYYCKSTGALDNLGPNYKETCEENCICHNINTQKDCLTWLHIKTVCWTPGSPPLKEDASADLDSATQGEAVSQHDLASIEFPNKSLSLNMPSATMVPRDLVPRTEPEVNTQHVLSCSMPALTYFCSDTKIGLNYHCQSADSVVLREKIDPFCERVCKCHNANLKCVWLDTEPHVVCHEGPYHTATYEGAVLAYTATNGSFVIDKGMLNYLAATHRTAPTVEAIVTAAGAAVTAPVNEADAPSLKFEITQATGDLIARDLKVTKSQFNSYLEKRHNYALQCKTKAGYDLCAGYSHKYHCIGTGQVAFGVARNNWCDTMCSCKNIFASECPSILLAIVKACSRSVTTDIQNDKLEPRDPDSTALEPQSLDKRHHNYALQCKSLDGFKLCSGYAHGYFCAANGKLMHTGNAFDFCEKKCICGSIYASYCPSIFLNIVKACSRSVTIDTEITKTLEPRALEPHDLHSLDLQPHTLQPTLDKGHEYALPYKYFCSSGGDLLFTGTKSNWCLKHCKCNQFEKYPDSKSADLAAECPKKFLAFVRPCARSIEIPEAKHVNILEPRHLPEPHDLEPHHLDSRALEPILEDRAIITADTDTETLPPRSQYASQKRHNFVLQCSDRLGYDSCSSRPCGYYCKSNGKVASLYRENAWCTWECRCQLNSWCCGTDVFRYGSCYPISKTTNSTGAGNAMITDGNDAKTPDRDLENRSTIEAAVKVEVQASNSAEEVNPEECEAHFNLAVIEKRHAFDTLKAVAASKVAAKEKTSLSKRTESIGCGHGFRMLCDSQQTTFECKKRHGYNCTSVGKPAFKNFSERCSSNCGCLPLEECSVVEDSSLMLVKKDDTPNSQYDCSPKFSMLCGTEDFRQICGDSQYNYKCGDEGHLVSDEQSEDCHSNYGCNINEFCVPEEKRDAPVPTLSVPPLKECTAPWEFICGSNVDLRESCIIGGYYCDKQVITRAKRNSMPKCLKSSCLCVPPPQCMEVDMFICGKENGGVVDLSRAST